MKSATMKPVGKGETQSLYKPHLPDTAPYYTSQSEEGKRQTRISVGSWLLAHLPLDNDGASRLQSSGDHRKQGSGWNKSTNQGSIIPLVHNLGYKAQLLPKSAP